MSIMNEDGATLSETAVNALTSSPPSPPVLRVMTADVFQRFSYDNAGFEEGTRLLFHNGQVVAQSTIDALFADATIASITPATGAAAGSTDVVITGTNFGGVLGVSIGGVAATMVKIVSETTLTCRTGAHAAGAVNVVVTDDSGAVTATGAYTYV